MKIRDRIILHIDMDSFFASVESKRRGIIDEPIVICVYSGRSEDSGAVSTANYLAREYGIKAGMPIRRAKKIAKENEEELGKKFHFIPVDKEYYKKVSEEIRSKILENYADRMEQASIDEFYLDISDEVDNWEEAGEIGDNIKESVKKNFDLSCSVGIGPNKLVAKIASDRNKPDGLTLVKTENVKDFLFSLDLEDIHGIGSKTVERLFSLGIYSVRDLSKANVRSLIEEFGENLGPKLKMKSKGIDDSEVKERRQKQFSRITTLKENSNDFEYISGYLEDLASELEKRLGRENLFAEKTALITIDTNLKMRTRSKNFDVPSRKREIILSVGSELLKEFLNDFDGEIRRVGLRVMDLKELDGQKKLLDF